TVYTETQPRSRPAGFGDCGYKYIYCQGFSDDEITFIRRVAVPNSPCGGVVGVQWQILDARQALNLIVVIPDKALRLAVFGCRGAGGANGAQVAPRRRARLYKHSVLKSDCIG